MKDFIEYFEMTFSPLAEFLQGFSRSSELCGRL